MRTRREPYLLDLGSLGVIEGSTIYQADGEQRAQCRYIGGLPYAQPHIPNSRWKRARKLPEGHEYGTKESPGRFMGQCAVCPQPRREGLPDTSDRWSEDCFQSNIWIPLGSPPEGGWPVYFYIHGGSLQFGSPNEMDYTELLGDGMLKAILVVPAYRLNAFGFLASEELRLENKTMKEPVGNYGFWDQRMALEWTYARIAHFGGNPSNITLAGMSAGAHSAFHQLSYELGHPEEKAVIRRVIMHSNSCGMQPKYLDEAQTHFDELIAKLKISPLLSPGEKIERLRATSAEELVEAATQIGAHEIRALSGGAFVRKTLFREIDDGTFAREMRKRGIRLLIGECRDEHYFYSSYRPPAQDSYAGLRARLLAEYPRSGVETLLRLYCPEFHLPPNCKNWYDALGLIVADIQVHAFQRGFVDCLIRGRAADLVHRYRIEWRAQETDVKTPVEWGVTHATDNSIWAWGEGRGLSTQEKQIAKTAFMVLYNDFVSGQDISDRWGNSGSTQIRTMKSDGQVVIWDDEIWDHGLKVWDNMRDVGFGRSES